MKMGIEQNGSGGNGKGKVSCESRKGKRRQRKMSAVQRLYETCKDVFADCGPGIVPSPENVQRLAALLGYYDCGFFVVDRIGGAYYVLVPTGALHQAGHPKIRRENNDGPRNWGNKSILISASVLMLFIVPCALEFVYFVHTKFHLLDRMSETDVGLRPNMAYFSRERAPVITYLQLYECDQFSIGIFCLPETSVIPLHNHPGMTVFSKLLFGTMHIRSYDWAHNNNTSTTISTALHPKYAGGLRLAKRKVNTELTPPCATSILYPSDGGNMHRFTAKTACAVLDVLGPPYCDPEGRHCQYYHEFPFNHISVENVVVGEEEEEGYAWLKEREIPKEHIVVGLPYNGPKIVKK